MSNSGHGEKIVTDQVEMLNSEQHNDGDANAETNVGEHHQTEGTAP